MRTRAVLFMLCAASQALAGRIVTRDGVVHEGEVLDRVQNGYVFREEKGTVVIPFDQVMETHDLEPTPAQAPPPAKEEEEFRPHVSFGAGVGAGWVQTWVWGTGEFSKSIYNMPTRYWATGGALSIQNKVSIDLYLSNHALLGLRIGGGYVSGISASIGAMFALLIGRFYIGPAVDFGYYGFSDVAGNVYGAVSNQSYGEGELKNKGAGLSVGGRFGVLIPFTRRFGLGLEFHGMYAVQNVLADGDVFFSAEHGSEHLLNERWSVLDAGLTIQARWFL